MIIILNSILSLYFTDDTLITNQHILAGLTNTEGEVIEICPMIDLGIHGEELDQFPETLHRYIFGQDADSSRWLTYGYISMYNHSAKSNVDLESVYYKDRCLTASVANQPLCVGEELTINYGDDVTFS